MALCLHDCASDADFRLRECAPETALYCASGVASLCAARPRARRPPRSPQHPEQPNKAIAGGAGADLAQFIANRDDQPGDE
jgi:hypothetical protein